MEYKLSKIGNLIYASSNLIIAGLLIVAIALLFKQRTEINALSYQVQSVENNITFKLDEIESNLSDEISRAESEVSREIRYWSD